MGERLRQLQNWVAEQAEQNGLAVVSKSLQPVSGDASFRRYFRATGEQENWIAVDAPPEKEDSQPFVDIARHWHEAGVRVPGLIALDLVQGFMLLEDFGDRLMLPALNAESVDRLYGQAFRVLDTIQAIPHEHLPAYNEVLLRREMGLFDEWFVGRMLQLELSPAEQRVLDEAKRALVSNALEQVQVSVHRDYHSRNLMLLHDGELGVIDFQDAVSGPVTYDLVSLLRDSYVRWPDQQVARWVEDFRHRLALRGGTPTREAFLQQFDLMGMQRQLKVLGIFSRLCLRDGKAGYVQDMPRTLGYLYRAAGRHSSMAELQQLLDRRVVPAMARHPMFKEIDLDQELA
ncbi:aminoglycoside phosphotransferase [Marinobacterium zhoushanense]|uniref:Aminoglycoside phosphotransferase n=1 Tax=Marinobacterium zhoushanense TaxID=1679163 RepID=A0ABQ1K4J3_9GAMM|nr:phosphotransferase [Marinobacterium zhoushanense]GGB83832.1 aminoglycoside phosphotransferase [Marinobacterium zhoushanense]